MWVVDTCIVLDVATHDQTHGANSADLLNRLLTCSDLGICPITSVELAPAFFGDQKLQQQFLSGIGVAYDLGWTIQDTLVAQAAWTRWRALRQEAPNLPRRPLADVLIGAWASRHLGLVTRNPKDFRSIFPTMPIRVPGVD
jgi:predicted nucleic acid-binding protein